MSCTWRAKGHNILHVLSACLVEAEETSGKGLEQHFHGKVKSFCLCERVVDVLYTLCHTHESEPKAQKVSADCFLLLLLDMHLHAQIFVTAAGEGKSFQFSRYLSALPTHQGAMCVFPDSSVMLS